MTGERNTLLRRRDIGDQVRARSRFSASPCGTCLSNTSPNPNHAPISSATQKGDDTPDRLWSADPAWPLPAASARLLVQKTGDIGEIDSMVDIGLTDPAGEQERQGTRRHFLVVAHVIHKRRT